MTCMNDATLRYLSDFIKRPSPGFAVILSAPWGSGKTHLVRAFKEKSAPDALFVSLFGVTKPDDIYSAMLVARLPETGAKWLSALGAVGGVAVQMMGKNLPEFNSETFAKLALPKVLIFDDLERAAMPMRQILGVINGFVEGEGKHVILLANEDKLWTNKKDRSEREKVIGATLPVVADVKAALPGILDGAGPEARPFLEKYRDAIEQVFVTADHHNLRSLAQTLWDFGRFYCAIPNEMRVKDDPMRRLLSVFVALSLEFKAGTLGQKEMKQRDDISFKDYDPDWKVLNRVTMKYGSSDIRHGRYGAILPTDLAIQVLCQGAIDPQFVRQELGKTSEFRISGPEEPWVTVARAYDRDEKMVTKALSEMQVIFDNRECSDPAIFVEIFREQLSLPEMGLSDETCGELAEKCKCYVDDLVVARELPGFDPERHIRRMGGYGFDVKRFSVRSEDAVDAYGNALSSVISYLNAAQDDIFKQRFPNIVEELLALLATDSSLFMRQLINTGHDESIYAFHPVLMGIDAQVLATRTVKMPLAQQVDLLITLGERHKSWDVSLQPERGWLKKFVDALRKEIKTLSPFRQWQIEGRIKGHLEPRFQGWEQQKSEQP